jgi:glycine cleavage system H lipoate-binding protein
MQCPFFREALFRTCRIAPVRKPIPVTAGDRAAERCGSRAYAACPTYPGSPDDNEAAADACPFLQESRMQYCGAAPVAKFVPSSEPLASSCATDCHHYCELYVSMAHPHRLPAGDNVINVRAGMRYSTSHMWLDLTAEGACYAGIDAFLSRALGRVDRIRYVWPAGRHRPAAVVTVDGTDFEIIFPNSMLLRRCNLYLRADPSRLTADPYAAGWMFEGTPEEETSRDLLDAGEARLRMEEEVRRISEYLQEQLGFAADGGIFAKGVLRHLTVEERLPLFHEFFSFAERRRREP